jgi:8-oxo-dGTP pyrophosphatase MutT (NUDIX family)
VIFFVYANKSLVIAVVQQGDKVLMRKKPDGSPPYTQTWYLFGAELMPNIEPAQAIMEHVKQQAGIDITVEQKFSWDTEVKNDLDEVEKQFVYLDVLCEYKSGDLVPGPGIEKLEWVPKSDLANYDIVPPSVEVFKKLKWVVD